MPAAHSDDGSSEWVHLEEEVMPTLNLKECQVGQGPALADSWMNLSEGYEAAFQAEEGHATNMPDRGRVSGLGRPLLVSEQRNHSKHLHCFHISWSSSEEPEQFIKVNLK